MTKKKKNNMELKEIKKLSDYLVEVFKDIFATKEDVARIEKSLSTLQNSFDSVIGYKIAKDQEIVSIGHRLKNAEDWIDQAGPKIGLDFKH